MKMDEPRLMSRDSGRSRTLAIPSCHNNPYKASAIHKDKAQLDAALFDPPFRSFAAGDGLPGRVAAEANC